MASSWCPGVRCTDSKFEFGLFENFDITRSTFRDESKLHWQLLQYRTHLVEKRSVFNQIVRGQKSLLGGVVHGPFEKIKQGHRRIFDKRSGNSSSSTGLLEKSFATATDWYGALKALLTLYDTYKPTVTGLLRGEISSLNFGERKILKAKEKLDVYDLIDLAKVAYEIGWYDAAVDFAKVARQLWAAAAAATADGEQKKKNKQTDFKNRYYQDVLDTLNKVVPKMHNENLKKRRKIAGSNFKVHPFTVGDDFEKKSKQPKFLKRKKDVLDLYESKINEMNAHVGDFKENHFRRICGGHVVGRNVTAQGPQRCLYMDHRDPYLKLGPFKIEVLLKYPFRMIFHDFFSQEELKWMVDYSTPRMSRKRETSPNNIGLTKAKLAEGHTRTIHKTVQCWIPDKSFNESLEVSQVGEDFVAQTLSDPYSHTINFPVMSKLATKIEWATGMTVAGRFSSTDFQVTNYGLGGLCETHIDPHGYLEGRIVEYHQRNLVATGDMIATFMGWLSNVEAGGGTAFDYPDYEQLVQPTKGSAAFWFDLNAKGSREQRSSHGGCPVMAGSKWILNKWIFSFDQMDKFPCKLTEWDSIDPYESLMFRENEDKAYPTEPFKVFNLKSFKIKT